MDLVTIIPSHVFSPSFVELKIKDLSSLNFIEVVISPVKIKGINMYKFSYVDKKTDITKNYDKGAATVKIIELLKNDYKSIYIKTTKKDIQISNVNGSLDIREHKPTISIVNKEHDKKKSTIISSDEACAFLNIVGIQTKDGVIKANKWRKFHQIDEFLKIINKTVNIESLNGSVSIVDSGCGNAYLTFAAYYYFSEIKKLNTKLVGVDISKELVNRNNDRARVLGWEGMNFVDSSLESFVPETEPNIVLALHACDTATDDALVKAVDWNTNYIFVVPCCHKDIQQQLKTVNAPIVFKPLIREGILKERFGDLLTDIFRSLLLRMKGYKVDVFQFVSSTDTAKNIMIRAVKKGKTGDLEAKNEFELLRDYWNVVPYLEKLLENQK